MMEEEAKKIGELTTGIHEYQKILPTCTYHPCDIDEFIHPSTANVPHLFRNCIQETHSCKVVYDVHLKHMQQDNCKVIRTESIDCITTTYSMFELCMLCLLIAGPFDVIRKEAI